jgi:hypothetical protein
LLYCIHAIYIYIIILYYIPYMLYVYYSIITTFYHMLH